MSATTEPMAATVGLTSPATKTLDVSVVVVNHSANAKVVALLKDLDACTPVREVVIVDNGADPFPAPTDQRSFAVRVVRVPNRGFGSAVNEGIRHAASANLVISNPDVRLPDVTAIDQLVAALDDPCLGIAAPRITDEQGRATGDVSSRLPSVRASALMAMRRFGGASQAFPVGRVANVTGAFFAVRRSTWDLVGGFDEQYFMYFEDADLCARVGRAGLHIEVLDDARVVHEVGGTPASAEARRGWYRTSRAHYFATWRPRGERLLLRALTAGRR